MLQVHREISIAWCSKKQKIQSTLASALLNWLEIGLFPNLAVTRKSFVSSVEVQAFKAQIKVFPLGSQCFKEVCMERF